MLSPLITNPTTPIASLINLDSPLAFTLIYATHPAWPLAPGGSTSPSINPIRISVLDSSFNPPTKAHLSLANLGTFNKNNNDVSSDISSKPPSLAKGFDAQLLLLSIKNADKTPSSKDASTAQRLEMMRAMATEMLAAAKNGQGTGNIAVGCVLEPSFVGKSRVLKKTLEEIEESRVQEDGCGKSKLKFELGFAQGWDTLLRFFSPKYYLPPTPSLSASMDTFFITDSSFILCARRGSISAVEEAEFLKGDEVRKWVKKGTVKMMDLPKGDNLNEISSSAVRKMIADGSAREAVRKCVGEGVLRIIERDGLYKE